MIVAQNEPDITNFVTPVNTACRNHTPMLLVTPQATNKTIGQGGLQEVEQLALFRAMVAWTEEVRDPTRIAEVLNRVVLKAKRASASAQINVPREAIISSDNGHNCPIGNAHPTFEGGRKCLAPGLFGPCGYGLPAIIGSKIGRPDLPVLGFAVDGAFGISMNEMTAIGRADWPAITMVIFRNDQWGAEKRNTTQQYADNFVGAELNTRVRYAIVATACGLKGVQVASMDALTATLHQALADQTASVTTFIEVLLNQELSEPFWRDAMKAPAAVARIDRADMPPQAVA